MDKEIFPKYFNCLASLEQVSRLNQSRQGTRASRWRIEQMRKSKKTDAPCLTILQIWPFAAGLAQDGDRHSRLRQEFSNLDAVAFKIGLQLFRTG